MQQLRSGLNFSTAYRSYTNSIGNLETAKAGIRAALKGAGYQSALPTDLGTGQEIALDDLSSVRNLARSGFDMTAAVDALERAIRDRDLTAVELISAKIEANDQWLRLNV